MTRPGVRSSPAPPLKHYKYSTLRACHRAGFFVDDVGIQLDTKNIDVYSSGPWTYHPAGLTARSDVDTDIATQTVFPVCTGKKYSVRAYSGSLGGGGGAVVALGGFTTMVLGRP